MSNVQAKIEVDPAILADEGVDDYESSGYDTSTASLSSSINEYVFENGRRYHAYFGTDKNLHPTDEVEQDRLDMHHEIMLGLLKGELHAAPLEDPQRILDVGTGTGLWAIDAADKYPMAEVIGTDLSPIQPTWVPPNCKFEVDDAAQPWTFRDNSFDFVHCRNISQGIENWPKFMSEVYRCTVPGGYAELAEVGLEGKCDDGTMADDHPIKVHLALCGKAMEKINRPGPKRDVMISYLENAGFVDVQAFTYKQPIGPWPKEKRLKQIGAMLLMNARTAFHAYGMAAFTRILEMDPVEAEKLCEAAYTSALNKNNHVYNEFFVVYGRKPAADEE